MEASLSTSIFLAKLIGPICVVLGLALLFNNAGFRALAKTYLDNHTFIFLLGLISLPCGLAIVLTHNVWVVDWRLVITIIGWLAAVSGAIRLISPQRAAAMGHSMLADSANTVIAGIVYLAIGMMLCFFGYVH